MKKMRIGLIIDYDQEKFEETKKYLWKNQIYQPGLTSYEQFTDELAFEMLAKVEGSLMVCDGYLKHDVSISKDEVDINDVLKPKTKEEHLRLVANDMTKQLTEYQKKMERVSDNPEWAIAYELNRIKEILDGRMR